MKKQLKILLAKPEYSVIFILAILLVLYGGFNSLALFEMGVTIDPQWGMSVQATAGIVYFVSGLATLIGFFIGSRNLILQSSLAMFCCFFFAVVLRLLTFGLEPLGWLIFLFISAVVSVCRYHIEVNKE